MSKLNAAEPPRFNSTYGLRKDYSFKSEIFHVIPLTWMLGVCSIEALKIRVAKWSPKNDRSNSAIFYFDVCENEQALDILKSFESFDFKNLEDRFKSLFKEDKAQAMNTGETNQWLLKIIPLLRQELTFNPTQL